MPPGEGLGPGGGSGALPGKSVEELALRLSFTPTANISVIEAGDAGSESNVVPAVARARVQLQLVPNQDPDGIERKLRSHLDEHGFGDVALEVSRRIWPSPGVLGTRSPMQPWRPRRACTASRWSIPNCRELDPPVLLDVLGATTVSPWARHG